MQCDPLQNTPPDEVNNAAGEETDTNGLFFEVECHTLIGVATVWLECLYQNVPLDYSAPIISQQVHNFPFLDYACQKF